MLVINMYNILHVSFYLAGPPPPPYNPNPSNIPPQNPPPQPAANMYGGADYESGGMNAFSFSEKSIRMAFIR